MKSVKLFSALVLSTAVLCPVEGAKAAPQIAQAGPPAGAPPAGAPQPDAANSGPVKVSVSAQCEAGEAVFLVINEGDPWPVPSRIAVFRTQGQLLVSQRLMRLTAGQRASFRVKGAAASQAEFGVFVEPAWYQRPFTYDAKVTCK